MKVALARAGKERASDASRAAAAPWVQGGQQLLLLDAGQRPAYARLWNTLCEEHQIVTRSVARESFWHFFPVRMARVRATVVVSATAELGWVRLCFGWVRLCFKVYVLLAILRTVIPRTTAICHTRPWDTKDYGHSDLVIPRTTAICHKRP